MKRKASFKLSRREQQDLMDKIILLTLMKASSVRWTELEKNILGAHLPFATSQRFRSRMQYLLNKKLIERVKRGTYEITESGIKYLEALQAIYVDFDKKHFLTVK